jgi:hypothetical protein
VAWQLCCYFALIACLLLHCTAGTVLDAPAAAVYQLKKEGRVVGMAISSEATEL